MRCCNHCMFYFDCTPHERFDQECSYYELEDYYDNISFHEDVEWNETSNYLLSSWQLLDLEYLEAF